MAEIFTLTQGTILSDRYRIIRQIGQGGFGRTYLAEDIHRYNEYCVLKEFAPIVESQTSLPKAENLFEREAGILYKLKHPQIPKFKALLRTQIYNKRTLFLVQEYILGDTYDKLLQNRGKFTESEVINLMSDILPTLEYIHQQNLIHRDISPDNLIYRQEDKKPVLIDFGCVKLAANAVSRSQGYGVTLIGKIGYAPEEQMHRGIAFPNSDLYALAVTAIVLLTNKSPEQLYDNYYKKWQWEQEVKVSSQLTKVLNKMLSYHSRDRYNSSLEVLKALDKNSNTITSFISSVKTLIVAPKNNFLNNNITYSKKIRQLVSHLNRNESRFKTKAIAKKSNKSLQANKFSFLSKLHSGKLGKILVLVIVMASAIAFNNTLSKVRFSFLSLAKKAVTKTVYLVRKNDISSKTNIEEQTKQQNIHQRVKALNIDAAAFYNTVDREFYFQYPQMRGISLTNSKKHQKYSLGWYKIADRLLVKKEKSIHKN